MTSFWKLPDISEIRTPISVLKEQASALTKESKGLLVGEVKVRHLNDDFFFALYIVVPALNNYRYELVRIDQSIKLFPLVMKCNAFDQEWAIQNIVEFEDRLSSILGSDEVIDIITGLLQQARDLEAHESPHFLRLENARILDSSGGLTTNQLGLGSDASAERAV